MRKKYALACDLKDKPDLIAAYEEWHTPEKIWPSVLKSLGDSGILNMEIYRTSNRLFMVIEVDSSFSFERKASMDEANPKVQEWEELMDQFQQRLPWGLQGEKWVLMNSIFKFEKTR